MPRMSARAYALCEEGKKLKKKKKNFNVYDFKLLQYMYFLISIQWLVLQTFKKEFFKKGTMS